MYHIASTNGARAKSDMQTHRAITVGRSGQCDIVLDDASVSRMHARVELTAQGYLSVQDLNSTNGTFLNRSGHWIQVQAARLGRQDGVRFGQREVELEQLAAFFGDTITVRLRRDGSGRVSDRLLTDLPEERQVIKHPKRNPLTGKVEET